MKVLSRKIWLITVCLTLCIVVAHGQVSSSTAKIEALLQQNMPDNKVNVRKAGSVIVIETNNMGNEQDFQIPYAGVTYHCTYSNTKNNTDTLYQVSISCADNKDCIILYKNNKEERKKTIWYTFRGGADAYAFVDLMNGLKREK